MAQKAKSEAQPTFVDGEWESNGMYRWYIGPRKKQGKVKSAQRFADLKKYLRQPTSERLSEIREWFTEIVSPFWEGPLDESDFWQDQRRGSLGYGHEVDGRMRWARTPVGEIVCAYASTGDGHYRMVDGAPTGGYVRDAISALTTIRLLETKLTEGSDLDSIVRLSIELGQAIEQVRHQALFAPIVLVGRRLIVEQPKVIHKRRSETAAEQRHANRAEAEEALKWACKNFPSLVWDKQKDRLKEKAAEHIGISKRTLNRRLASD